ncbi:hypothetical protein LINGRAHAP2_LOCUS10232 [Linum grandiflorum]
MEVVLPSSPPGMGFDFNDARILPFLSAPSSPRRFGDLTLSAPSSPSRVADLYRSFEDFSHWESHHNSTPKTQKLPSFKFEDPDFAFDFSADSEINSLPADQLFDGGVIRPLKTLPQPEPEQPPRSPVERNDRGRGRRSDRDSGLTSSSSRRGTRSVSPYRVSQYPWEEQDHQFKQTTAAATTSTVSSSGSGSGCATTTSKSSSRKWRLRDLLLFRSASEGRAYGGFFKRHETDHHDQVKTCNVIRSSDSFGSSNNNNGAGKSSRRKAVSAHELHYKTNKAASEGLKKKTFLPYKQGILGRFAFSPALAR